MIATIKKFILSVSSLGLFVIPALAPATVYAQTGSDLPNKLNCGSSLVVNPDCNVAPNGDEAQGRVQNIVTLVVNIFSIIVGIVAVIMIIVGGLKYITSGGDSGNVTGAKNTILYAVVGLIVVALAQFIVRFVLANANKAGV